mgnify:FL=1
MSSTPSIAHIVPDYLLKAEATLVAAGFDAAAYVHEGFGVGLQTRRSQGIRVQVPAADPRICWHTHNSNVTAFVAQVHPNTALLATPTGFEFNKLADGSYSLAASLPDEHQADVFVECFRRPFGPDDAIMGPLARAAKAR